MSPTSPQFEFAWSWPRFLITAGLITFLIILAIVVSIWMSAGNPQPRYRVPQERIYRVSTQTLNAESLQPEISVNGTALAARQVDLRPLVAGRVIWVNPNLRDGGQLAAGEDVVRIDAATYELQLTQAQANAREAEQTRNRLSRDLERQAAQIALLEQQLDNLETELGRRADLLAQGLSSNAAFEQVESQVLAQQQALLSAENGQAALQDQIDGFATTLEQAQIGVTLAEQNVRDTALTTPFDGLVLASLVQEGQLVSQGDLAARLIDNSALEVQFRLPQDVFATLSRAGNLIGAQAQVNWQGTGSDDGYSGTIVRQGASLDPTAGGVPLFLALDTQAIDAGLRPGAFVSVRLKGRDLGMVYAIPRQSFFSEIDQNGGVYVTDQIPVGMDLEWLGPTDTRTVKRMNDWLAGLDPQGLAEMQVPASIVAAEAPQTLAELFTCVAIAQSAEETTTQTGTADDDLEFPVSPSNRPSLTKDQQNSLCPDGTMTIARAVPVELLSYSGDLALVTAAQNNPIEGLELITQRFDQLANGTWLNTGTLE